jgi:hypothetical protein
MKRRPKPEPALAKGERPPCGFLWQVNPDDGHLFSADCACGRPYSEHERYREAMRRGLAHEKAEAVLIRIQLDRALARAIPVRQRTPMQTGTLTANGHMRRYLLDGEAIDANEPEAE